MFLSCSRFTTNYILSQKCKKSLTIKAFDYPFRYKVSRFLRAEQHTPRVVIASIYIIERKYVKVILELYYGTELLKFT